MKNERIDARSTHFVTTAEADENEDDTSDSSFNPKLSGVSSGAMRSSSAMKRTFEAWGPKRLQQTCINFLRGVVFLILNRILEHNPACI
jgi:hypothetical protein